MGIVSQRNEQARGDGGEENLNEMTLKFDIILNNSLHGQKVPLFN